MTGLPETSARELHRRRRKRAAQALAHLGEWAVLAEVDNAQT